MSVDFPEELLLQILVRLPPKSLLQFRSVCKSWSLLISSSQFISSHKIYNHAVGNYNLLLRRFCNTEQKEIYSLHDESYSCRKIRELGFPFDRPERDYFTVVGCVDGLICLWDDTHELNPVTLWNPAIRKSFRVPDLQYNGSDDGVLACLKVAFGFGFDALANDYKILRIAFRLPFFPMNRRVDRRPMDFLREPIACSADVFSLNTKTWRYVSNAVPLQQLSVPIFLNGALHFLTRKDSNQWALVSFILNDETFKEMACPKDPKLGINMDHFIARSSESIFLLHLWPEHRYDIWVLKEYYVEESWTKLLSIESDMYLGVGWKRILGFSRNGGSILLGSGSWIGYLILETLKFVDFQSEGSYRAPHAEYYMESLVLLGDNNCITHLLQNYGDNNEEDHEEKRLVIHRVPGKRRGKRAHLN